MKTLTFPSLTCLLLTGCLANDLAQHSDDQFDGFEESSNHPALVNYQGEDKKNEINQSINPEQEIVTKPVASVNKQEHKGFLGFEESNNHPALTPINPSKKAMVNQKVNTTTKHSVNNKSRLILVIEPDDLNDEVLNSLLKLPNKGTNNSAFIYQNNQLMAVYYGNYKAYFRTIKNSKGDLLEHNPPLLFNLTTDPMETDNIAPSSPNILDEITKQRNLIAEQQ
jgi:hypothetical protein